MTNSPYGHNSYSPHPDSPPRPHISQGEAWQLAAGWVEGDGAHFHQQEAVDRMRRYRPNGFKQTLAWTNIAFGLLIVVLAGAMVADGAYNFWEGVGMMVFALMISLPGVYWVNRTRKDRKIVTEWVQRAQDQQRMRQFLQGPELQLLGEPQPTPLLPRRRWGMVVLGQFGLFLLFFVIVAFGFAPVA